MSLENSATNRPSGICSSLYEADSDENARRLPLYVAAGFLGAGKTTLLNHLLAPRLKRGRFILCIQFESGAAKLTCPAGVKGKLRVLTIPPRALETHRRKTEQLLYHAINDGLYDEVWVEWNGLQPLATLLSFFPKAMMQDTGTPGDLCALRRVLFVAQNAGLAELLAQTGGLLTEQLLNADVVVLRGVKDNAELSGLRAAGRDPQRQPRRAGRAQPPQRNCPRTGKAAASAAVAACAGLRRGALPAAAAWHRVEYDHNRISRHHAASCAVFVDWRAAVLGDSAVFVAAIY